MSCRRTCRELLSFVRFGEWGPRSQAVLDHLADCRGCRDEVGLDREMVRQLRAALLERVVGAQPSPAAWEGILRRTQTPEPSRLTWWERSIGVVGRLRTATAMAGAGLALVLALQMEIMPVPMVTPSHGAEASASIETSVLDPPRLPPRTLQSVGGGPQVRTAPPHPETTMVLPLARPEVPAMQVFPSLPGELGTLDLAILTGSTATDASTDPIEPEPDTQPAPSPAELGIPS